MVEVVLSQKYQIVIPKQIRKRLALKTGQRIELLIKEGLITLVPERPLKEFRGFLGKMRVTASRDHSERI